MKQRRAFILIVIGCGKNVSTPLILDNVALSNTINTYLDTTSGVLGALVGIDYQGIESWYGSGGFFEHTKTTVLNPHDRFLAGSITKMFSAVSVMMLYEDGLIELDSAIISYLPENQQLILDSIQYGSQITVLQALSHRSGLFNFSRIWSLIEQVFNSPKTPVTATELLTLIKDNGTPDFIPGESYRYSNSNYLLLGEILKHITGSSLSEVFNEFIINPLDLSDTYLSQGLLGLELDGIAHGYDFEFGRLYDGQDFFSIAPATGGIVSNTRDLIAFLKAIRLDILFQRISGFNQLTDTHCNADYGLGFIIGEHDILGNYFGHGGGVFGTYSLARYYLENDVVIVCSIMLDGTVEYVNVENLMERVIETINNEDY